MSTSVGRINRPGTGQRSMTTSYGSIEDQADEEVDDLELSFERRAVGGGGLLGSIQQFYLSYIFIGVVAISTLVFTVVVTMHSSSSYSENASEISGDFDDVIASSQLGDKPHILILLADDLGWNSIGYENYDLDFVTPTLTSLAQEGVILNHFYGQEVCTPSRASLLTGRYPLSIGMQFSMVQTAIPWGLDFSETTMAEVLKDNGYSTHLLGKWHLGHYSPRMLPTARGFQTFLGYLNGENYYWSKKNPDHETFRDLLYSNESCYTPYTGDDIHNYSTFLYRDKAIEIINNHDDTDSSLFLFMSFQAVHDPFVDVRHFQSGIPAEYLDNETYSLIHSTVQVRRDGGKKGEEKNQKKNQKN